MLPTNHNHFDTSDLVILPSHHKIMAKTRQTLGDRVLEDYEEARGLKKKPC